MNARLISLLVGCMPAALASAAAAATPADPAPASQSATGVPEIIVTAERVTSLASRTPAALTVLTGKQLLSAGITDPSTLPQFIPDFQIDPGNNNRITIRGITSFDTTNKGDPSAAFMLDGVYIARSQDTDITFFDVARIEELSGPQGTLYGRNSTAGVVDVISNPPVDRYEGAVDATVGNFGTYYVDAMANIPVSPAFDLRAAAAWDQRNNYLIPQAGDPIKLGLARDNVSLRVQGLIKFGDKATLLLKADYRNIHADSNQDSVLTTNFFNITNPLNPIYVGGSEKAERTLTFAQGAQPFENGDTWGLSAEFKWDLGPLTLTYLGSHRETTIDQEFNFFFFSDLATFEHDHHSQDSDELRFATNGDGPFKAQFGAYYFHEQVATSEVNPGLGIPGLPDFGLFENPTVATSYAGFGQLTYDVTPRLHLTGGIRYTHDDKSRVGGDALQAGLQFNPATDLLFVNSASASFSKVTWKAAVNFDLTPSSILYADVATGYKSGGFNDGCLAGSVFDGTPCNQVRPANVLFYQPELLTAYEGGAKLRLLDNRLQWNTSAFHYDYQNLQLQSIVILSGNPSSEITNAAKARVNGVESDALWALDARNQVNLQVTFLDGRYQSYFPLGNGTPPSYSGKYLDNAPPFSVAAGWTYTYPLSNGGDLAFNVYSRYTDSYVVSSFTVPVQYRQPGFSKTNLTLTYQPTAKPWYIQLFAKNLEDNIQITSAALESVNISEPRTFGVRAGAKF